MKTLPEGKVCVAIVTCNSGQYIQRCLDAVLRQDGSPPLYYALLHVWMAAFGRTETATHALSLVFALATVPAGLWLGRTLFGVRVGWTCAVLCALNPLLSAYAQETRMYSLVALLSLLVSGAFVHVFVYRRRGYRAAANI